MFSIETGDETCERECEDENEICHKVDLKDAGGIQVCIYLFIYFLFNYSSFYLFSYLNIDLQKLFLSQNGHIGIHFTNPTS